MKILSIKFHNKKSLTIPLIFLIFLNFFVSLQNCNIVVGFFSSNLDGKIYEVQEFNEILNTFTFIAKNNYGIQKIVSFDNISNPESFDLINKYDVLLISFQNSRSGFQMSNFKEILKGRAGQENLWNCSNDITQEGKTKNDNQIILAKICYKEQILVETIVKQGEQSSNNSKKLNIDPKTSLGVCLKIKGIETGENELNNPQFCFLGIHLDYNLNKGFKMTKEMIDYIYLKAGYSRDVYIYIVGNFNTRSLIPDKPVEMISRSLINFEGNPDSIRTNMDKADEEVVKLFEDNVKSEGSKGNFKFCGNQSLRELPYTYQYLKPKSFKDNISQEDFDLVEITKKNQVFSGDIIKHDEDGVEKKQRETLEAYNLGWLDRMACVHIDNSVNSGEKVEDCRLASEDLNKGVFYSAVPSLRLGSHMPILGYFNVKSPELIREAGNTSTNKKKRLKKKLKKFR